MDTYSRLINATQELLWQKGYSAVSPKDIQRKANAGQGSMYHHFTSKQHLAIMALEANAEQLRVITEELLKTDGTAIEKIEAYLTAQRDSLLGCRVGRMTYDDEILNSDELLLPITRTFEWLLESLASIIEQGINSGELSNNINPYDLASTIIAVVQGGYVLARAKRNPNAFQSAINGIKILLQAVSKQ